MTENAGVWTVGDVRNTPFKRAFVICSDGCIAAMAIDKFTNQRKHFRGLDAQIKTPIGVLREGFT